MLRYEKIGKEREEIRDDDILKDLFLESYFDLGLDQFVENETVRVDDLCSYLERMGFSYNAIENVRKCFKIREDKAFKSNVANQLSSEYERLKNIRTALTNAFNAIEDAHLREYLLERIDSIIVYLVHNWNANLEDERGVDKAVALYLEEEDGNKFGHDIDNITVQINLARAKSDEIEFYLSFIQHSWEISQLLNSQNLGNAIISQKEKNPTLGDKEALDAVIKEFSDKYFNGRYKEVLKTIVVDHYKKNIKRYSDQFMESTDKKEQDLITIVMHATGNQLLFAEKVGPDAALELFNSMARVGVPTEEMSVIANHLFAYELISMEMFNELVSEFQLTDASLLLDRIKEIAPDYFDKFLEEVLIPLLGGGSTEMNAAEAEVRIIEFFEKLADENKETYDKVIEETLEFLDGLIEKKLGEEKKSLEGLREKIEAIMYK